VVLERTNARQLTAELIGGLADMVVADLAFISLRTVAPALDAVCERDGTMVLMVKPQFELPRDEVPRGGVVREPNAWAAAMHSVAGRYAELGWGLHAAVVSELAGPKGNREFFLHLRRSSDGDSTQIINAAAARVGDGG
jgi:23S rRNA (cytidine1920-2'-O)/16S rRNA (cytidine1409-2'-O)-methyltransferase